MKRIFINIIVFAMLSITVNSFAASQFIDMGNGAVRDSATGLFWLKNANCFGVNNWYVSDNYISALGNGGCNLSDGSKARDWYMPDKNTLKSFSDAARLSNWNTFINLPGTYYWYYWTTTPSPNGGSFGIIVDVKSGTIDDTYWYGSGGYLGTAKYYVWPVRSGYWGYIGAFGYNSSGIFNPADLGGSSRASYAFTKLDNLSDVLTKVTITGTNQTDFTIANDTCSDNTINLGGTCIIDVIFFPSTADKQNGKPKYHIRK